MGRSTINLLGKSGAIDEAKQQVLELEKEQAELLEMRERVESDEFIEREAREKLGLAKRGEVVVVLPDDEVLKKLAPPIEIEKFAEEDPIWKRWSRLFF